MGLNFRHSAFDHTISGEGSLRVLMPGLDAQCGDQIVDLAGADPLPLDSGPRHHRVSHRTVGPKSAFLAHGIHLFPACIHRQYGLRFARPSELRIKLSGLLVGDDGVPHAGLSVLRWRRSIRRRNTAERL